LKNEIKKKSSLLPQVALLDEGNDRGNMISGYLIPTLFVLYIGFFFFEILLVFFF